MWERMTCTRIRLDKDARSQIGAMLIVLRNEFIAGATTAGLEPVDEVTGQVKGSSVNYRRMIECIDRIISRLHCSFDVTKLNQAYCILARAESNSKDMQVSTQALEEATDHYGSLGLDGSRDRVTGAGHDKLPDATGDADIGRPDIVTGGGSDDTQHVDARP